MGGYRSRTWTRTARRWGKRERAPRAFRRLFCFISYAPQGKAMTDWGKLEDEVYGLFSPGAPIRVEAELSGRLEQSAKLRRIVLSPGEHALVYGERGVGKTSIANSFYGSLNSPTRPVLPVLVNCGSSNSRSVGGRSFDASLSPMERQSRMVTRATSPQMMSRSNSPALACNIRPSSFSMSSIR